MFNLVEEVVDVSTDILKASPILIPIFWGLLGRINSLNPAGVEKINSLLAIEITLVGFQLYKALGLPIRFRLSL